MDAGRPCPISVGMLVLLLSVMAGGCASSGPRHSEIKDSLPSLQPGQGRVYFYRESSAWGAAIQTDIRLNSEVVGRSQPGGFFFVDRPPGAYTASSATEVENTVTFKLEAQQTRFVKTYVTFGILIGRVQLQLIDGEQAITELAQLHYIGDTAALSKEAQPGEVSIGARSTTKPTQNPVELDELKYLLPGRSP